MNIVMSIIMLNRLITHRFSNTLKGFGLGGMRLLISLLAAMMGMMGSASADTPYELTGNSYRVVDGDTIHLSGEKIRLLGIDAPEMKQYCQGQNGLEWACGLRARDMLLGMLAAQDIVSCTITGKDRYKRLLGRCYAGATATGVDVQRALVLGGFAVAEYTDDYQREESQASAQKRGMWNGEFLRPYQFRKKSRNKN